MGPLARVTGLLAGVSQRQGGPGSVPPVCLGRMRLAVRVHLSRACLQHGEAQDPHHSTFLNQELHNLKVTILGGQVETGVSILL
jgi:hypothetical protein